MDYKTAGVDIEAGDSVSKKAYKNAQKTFPHRAGKIGAPVSLDGGFAGALDFGDYYLIQNDDGTGSKSEIAEAIGKYDTLGADLVAMVADDAICVGAEVVSLSNTFDVPHIDDAMLDGLTASLAEACIEEQIVIPGGEIAEVPGSVNKIVWNATSVGVVKKDKFLTGKNIKSGHKIIGLNDPMLRSNGFTLARKILETNLGPDYFHAPFDDTQTWGQILLTPSKIFHRLLLDTVVGDFEGDRIFDISGICHVTGGGIAGNVPRILPDGLGARFDNLHTPHAAIQQLAQMGNVADTECYRSWHCGTAMMVFAPADMADAIITAINHQDPSVNAQIVGTVTDTPEIEILSKFSNRWI